MGWLPKTTYHISFYSREVSIAYHSTFLNHLSCLINSNMNIYSFTILLALLSYSRFSAASGDEDWEWSAALCVEDTVEKFNWNFAKVDDAYAASTMKMVILSTDQEGEAGVTAKHSDAEEIFDGSSGTTVTADPGDTLSAGNYLYELNMDNDAWMSVFKMNLTEGEYAVFLEHDPDEFHFEDMDSYITTSDGDEAVFDWTSSDATTDSNDEKWDLAYGASVLVWLATFAMICLFYVTKITSMYDIYTLKLDNLQMFAAGTLIASAFSLVLFESAHTLSDETGVASLWSTCAILGFLCSSLVDIFTKQLVLNQKATKSKAPEGQELEMVPGKDDSMEVVSSEVVEDGAEKDKNGDNALVSLDLLSLSEVLAIESSRKTFMSLMIGDFICNYSDGVIIGSAFSQCNSTLGWTIALATILHELPQELADAGILVDQLRLGHAWAALSNLLCGVAVLLGCATVNASDINEETKAYFLAFGAGNFLYLAAVEFFGKVFKEPKNVSIMTRCEQLLYFFAGALIILLIAMDHAHCEAESSGDSDSSHAHDH